MASPLPPGTRVRVSARMPIGHVRTPAYLRGRSGVIERVLGRYACPERRAYRQEAPERQLYRVRFDMAALWGEGAEPGAATLDAEIYDHWLEPDPDAP